MTGPSDIETAPPPDAGIFGLTTPVDRARLVLIPMPFDATTSYGAGTSDGPRAVLRASHQLDLHDPELGDPTEAGIVMLDENPQIRRVNEETRQLVQNARKGYARGEPKISVARIDAYSLRLNDWLYEETKRWLGRGHIVGVVGGEHSVMFGALRAILERHPNLAILQVDAHADLRRAYEGFTWSHASIMHNVLERTLVRKVVQVGVRDLCKAEADRIAATPHRIATYFDAAMAADQFSGQPFHAIIHRIVEELPRDVYISFDIDGLDPALCPHTGTPVPGGLSFHQASALLSLVSRSGRRVVGFDLTEVAPGPTGDGLSASAEWDGNVGARILYRLCGHALLPRS